MNSIPAKLRATVIGAGFTGLATAYALERAGYAVDVYERSSRAGGLLGTRLNEHGMAESGANAFLNSPRVEALFADLEIPVVPAGRESRRRYIFRWDRPRRWPLGFSGTLRVLRFGLSFLFARDRLRPRAGESVAAWGERTLGRETTDFFLLPALQGIYAGEGGRLSASLLLGALFGSRRGPRPRIRGSVTAPGGMGEFIAKLQAKLAARGVRFHFGMEAPTSPPVGPVYYCGSARQTAVSLERIAPDLSRRLARIEMLPLVSITAFFPADPRIRPGFGVLFPTGEGFRSLGVLYNQHLFPGRARSGLISETWILGGARHAGVSGLSDDALIDEVLADRGRLHAFGGKSPAPIHFAIHRWPHAIPHYTVELEKILEEIAEYPPPGSIRILGNYLGGIGLAKILDRVFAAVAREPRT